MKVLIDTNILIDYIMNREPYAEIASEIVMMCAEKKIDGCIAAHSVPNIFFILRKSLSPHDRRNILKSLFTIFSVESIDREKLLSALDNNDFADFEDSLQEECAITFSADYIITRNEKDFEKSRITAVTPEKFIEIVK